jgi:hypothetical protein
VWFGTIATLGAFQIAREPGVLLALNPWVRHPVSPGPRGGQLSGARCGGARRDMIGPKTPPTRAVPYLWTKNSKNRMTSVEGST